MNFITQLKGGQKREFATMTQAETVELAKVMLRELDMNPKLPNDEAYRRAYEKVIRPRFTESSPTVQQLNDSLELDMN